MKCLHNLLVALMLAAPARQALAFQEAAPQTSDSRGRTLRLVVMEEILDELAHLAETSRRETVRCLIGVVRGDTALIDLAWTPPIHGSSSSSVQFEHCPLATIAEWHNHPWTDEPTPESACYLSEADIAGALRPGGPLVQFVQVTRAVSCWWLRSQIAKAQDWSIFWAVPGQRTPNGPTIAWAAVRQLGLEEPRSSGHEAPRAAASETDGVQRHERFRP